eukprot:COSAG03_NODE_3489_length_1985_cov_662.415164_3_plen_51_part_00
MPDITGANTLGFSAVARLARLEAGVTLQHAEMMIAYKLFPSSVHGSALAS